MRVHLSILFGVLAVTLGGCSREQPQFAPRPELSQLIPQVQEQIESTLQSHFGSPTDMVAWERLPIHYHVATGALTNVDAALADGKPGGAQLGVDLTTQNRPIEPGDQITFLSGIYLNAPQRATVEGFNPDDGLLTLQEDGFNPAPAVGDRIVIGPGVILEQGRVLYAEHCQHCHGVSGDGNGPTARYLNPRPRDYRLGLFKFTSTKPSDKASRDDLQRTIAEGIAGTYMPSFKLLTENEMQAIVEYILWLSMRGEVENGQIKLMMLDYSKESVDSAITSRVDSSKDSENPLSRSEARQQILGDLETFLQEEWPEGFNGDTQFLAEQWENAQLESAIVYPTVPRVPDTPESRQKGREIFLSKRGQCMICHGPQGRGDGAQTVSVQKAESGQDYPLPGLYDAWGNPQKPRDLTTGIYRGGRRPIDLYRRLYAGIKGTQMPPFGTVLKEEEIWHVVNYVYSIPFAARESVPGEGAHETLPEPEEVAATTRASSAPSN